jgi:hypothetical protein
VANSSFDELMFDVFELFFKILQTSTSKNSNRKHPKKDELATKPPIHPITQVIMIERRLQIS